MTHKEVWKAPFRTSFPYIFTSNGKMALTIYDDKAKRILDTICSILNGKGGTIKTVEREDAITFLVNGSVLVVRGWGYLTGVGGLNLPEEEAVKVQDEFAEWIFETLKAHVVC